MIDPTPTPAPAPSAPPVAAPVTPSADPAPVERSLAQFRADRAKEAEPQPEPVAPPAPVVAVGEPPEGPDEDEQPPVIPAPQADGHRWKDPVSGVRLDLRRRDHRRIKTLLEDGHRTAEENRELRARVASVQQPAQPQPQARPQAQPQQHDPNDPEPQLEQFADQADPYAAHTRALARWEARQEFKSQSAQRSSVERAQRATAALSHAQSEYDAGLPQARERYQDFDEAHQDVLDTLGRVPMQVRTPLVHRLLTSPLRHDLTHYLGSHPDDFAAVLQARSAHEQGLVLGAIETRVRALVNQRTKPAHPNPPAPLPAPMAPVNSGGTPTAYNPATASLAQFRRKHGVRGGRAVSA